MRKQPGSPPTVTPKQNDKIITQERVYELITPLFGGGVTPGEADPVTIIRGAEIRGHLRFWWRACRGGQFNGNLRTMLQKEKETWGAAYKKGEQPTFHDETIQIAVEILNKGTPIPFNDNRIMPAYAAFPLQSDPKPVRKDISFRLTISYPEKHKEEVEAALWAWETFGGIGARTRRGFGALRCISIKENGQSVPVDLPQPSQAQAMQWIQTKLKKYVEGSSWPSGIPHLTQNVLFRVVPSRPKATALDVWQNLINILKRFRQARSKGTAGRSFWPEPEAIRQITGHRDTRYKPLSHPQKFPRAAFGLPIIFHFKDTKTGDPDDTTLQGTEKEIERLASPLILRPIVCNNNQPLGLALILDGSRPIPGPPRLIGKNTGHTVEETLTKDEAKIIPVLNGETNVLQAFMNYIGGATR